MTDRRLTDLGLAASVVSMVAAVALIVVPHRASAVTAGGGLLVALACAGVLERREIDRRYGKRPRR